MAKRDIPEINAGSMADIAFLLLIFFLVTTTMDKDQAFLRSIPKKVENPPPPQDIEKRNIFAIKANNKNQLLVRGELMRSSEDISERIIEFYRYNEKSNNLSSNYPLYSRTSMDAIDGEIAKIETEIERMENTADQSQDILDYQYQALDEWLVKKNAMKLYGRSILPEVAPEAHVRVEVQIKTQYSLLTEIHTEVQEAIYTLKNDKAKELWGTSYDVLTKKVDTDPLGSVEEKKKLDLLDILYNVRIVEVTPK